MPLQVTPWQTGNPVTAKSMNLALYTADGSQGNPNGILWQAQRPVFLENYTAAGTVPASAGGTRSSLALAAGRSPPARWSWTPPAYYGQTSDLPGRGYYQYTPVIKGLLRGRAVRRRVDDHRPLPRHHLPGHPDQRGRGPARKRHLLPRRHPVRRPSTSRDSTPFYLDLRNTGINTWQPAVLIDDSGAASTTIRSNLTDCSGEATKLYAIWAGVSAASTNNAFFTKNGTYNFTAPAGVTTVSVQATGAGGGGGAGQGAYRWRRWRRRGVGAEHRGGGDPRPQLHGGRRRRRGRGALSRAGTAPPARCPVSPGTRSPSPPTPGRAAPGPPSPRTAPGGRAGTGSTAPSHNNGGAGAAGATGSYGGGGGSSASSAAAGNTASGAAGAAAPSGGGNGGNGGTDADRPRPVRRGRGLPAQLLHGHDALTDPGRATR